MRQWGHWRRPAAPLVSDNDGHERGELLERNQGLIVDVSQPQSCRCSGTSHRSKYEMDPSGDGQ